MTNCLACRYSSHGHCAKHPALTPTDVSYIETLWHEADDAERDASTWESEFLASIREQLDAGRDLSRKQFEKLEEVHARLTGDEDEPSVEQ